MAKKKVEMGPMSVGVAHIVAYGQDGNKLIEADVAGYDIGGFRQAGRGLIDALLMGDRAWRVEVLQNGVTRTTYVRDEESDGWLRDGVPHQMRLI